MKIVLYTSSTGFTKRYAEWIAEELHCEAMPLKKAKNLNSYDTVIYGGWIMGSMIMGLNDLKKRYQGKIVLFAVGSSEVSDQTVETIKKQNNLGQTPFYYFIGGFCFEKLGFFKKTMLNMIKKSLTKKENKTEQDLYMEKALSASFDSSNRSLTKNLIAYVQG